MHIRVATRRNSDGTPVRYLQLAHNEWDASTKTSRPKVLYSFGREDTLDRAMIERLVASLCRLLDLGAALAATTTGGLQFVSSRAYGGAWVLDPLWRRLGIDKVMTRLLAGTRRDRATERVLFALVANRALAASSKLAAAGWVERAVHIDGLPATTDDACYRAMDWLHEVAPELERQVFDQVAHLLNLHVDLLFFDTTSTYFELDEADEPVARDERGHVLTDTPVTDPVHDTGFRTWGNSKDHRGDLPQIVVGLAVTRDAIPVRVWSWPGNTGDSTLIRQVKTDMRDWTLTRIVWVADAGSPPRPTAGRYAPATTTTSWARSCAASPPRPPRRCRGRAATRLLRATCASRKSTSARGNGSSSATTPRPPTATHTPKKIIELTTTSD